MTRNDKRRGKSYEPPPEGMTKATRVDQMNGAEDVIDTALQMMRDPMTLGDARAARSALTEWMVERQKTKVRARRALTPDTEPTMPEHTLPTIAFLREYAALCRRYGMYVDGGELCSPIASPKNEMDTVEQHLARIERSEVPPKVTIYDEHTAPPATASAAAPREQEPDDSAPIYGPGQQGGDFRCSNCGHWFSEHDRSTLVPSCPKRTPEPVAPAAPSSMVGGDKAKCPGSAATPSGEGTAAPPVLSGTREECPDAYHDAFAGPGVATICPRCRGGWKRTSPRRPAPEPPAPSVSRDACGCVEEDYGRKVFPCEKHGGTTPAPGKEGE